MAIINATAAAEYSGSNQQHSQTLLENAAWLQQNEDALAMIGPDRNTVAAVTAEGPEPSTATCDEGRTAAAAGAHGFAGSSSSEVAPTVITVTPNDAVAEAPPLLATYRSGLSPDFTSQFSEFHPLSACGG